MGRKPVFVFGLSVGLFGGRASLRVRPEETEDGAPSERDEHEGKDREDGKDDYCLNVKYAGMRVVDGDFARVGSNLV